MEEMVGSRVRYTLGPLVCAAILASLWLPMPASAQDTSVKIRLLSNRADLISGGDALVELVLPGTAQAKDVRVRNHGHDIRNPGRDISTAFARRSDGRVIGLVEGLEDGPNVLSAQLPDGRGAQITVTNHPSGGPVISGPQLQPWACTTEENELGPPIDDQCNAPARHDYYYVPVGANDGPEIDAAHPFFYENFFYAPEIDGTRPPFHEDVEQDLDSIFQPYDPQSPPPAELVATTTTDEGETVPYIVRVERLTLNRGIQEFAVLFDPEARGSHGCRSGAGTASCCGSSEDNAL